MTMAYIRDYYKVPAVRGGIIRFGDRQATILSATHQLHVRFTDDGTTKWIHPTWFVEYQECHNIVEVPDGREEPCDRPAVGFRVDPEFIDYGEYPVCSRHLRGPFTKEEALAMLEGTAP